MEDYLDDPYSVLNVSRGATADEIKKAYRKLALKHHPDRKTDAKEKEEANHKFASISHAYEVLSDPSLKREYDSLTTSGGGSKKSSSSSGGVAKGFRPVFTDPYEIWKKDFEDEFGFEYPGAQYDFISHDDAAKNHPQLLAAPASPTKSKKGKKDKKDKSKKDKKSAAAKGPTPEQAKENQIVKKDDNSSALVVSAGINNRPIEMERIVEKQGPITVTKIKMKRPDGSTEWVTMRTGIPGAKPKHKMIEGPAQNKMIEGPKQNKMIEGEKKKKKFPLLTNGSSKPAATTGDEKPKKRGLLGWRKQ